MRTYRKNTLAVLLFWGMGFLVTQAQNWNTIRYKDLVSFQLPAGYTIQDTAGTKIYQSEIEDTTYICTFVEDVEPIHFGSVESITAFYNDFFDGLLAKSNKPKVLKKEVIQFGKFKAFRASLERNVIKKELTWELLVLHIKNTTLTFQGLTQNKAKAQYERLLTSIQFNESLTEKDQIDPSILKPERSFLEKYGAYFLVGIAVVVAVGFLQKRKKQ